MLKPQPLPLLPQEEEDIFEDIDSSDDDDNSEFDKLIKEELRAKDYSIELDNLNDIEFIDSGRSELLLDSLIRDAINIGSLELNSMPRTYREVLNSIKKQLNSKYIKLLPRLHFDYYLI
jgi:hypothetical protein